MTASLTLQHIELLRKSVHAITPDRGQEICSDMLRRLFIARPDARRLFPRALGPHSQRVWLAVQLAVNSISPNGLARSVEDEIRAMGRRHIAYGAKPEHYPILHDALIGALRDEFADSWDNDHYTAWSQFIMLIAACMLEADRNQG